MSATAKAIPGARLTLIIPTEGPLATQTRGLGIDVELLALPDALAELGDSALKRAGRARAAVGLAGRMMKAWPALLQHVHDLRRLLGRLQPSLIHSNGIKTHLALALSAGGSPRIQARRVWHVHDFLRARPLIARPLGVASRSVSAIVAVSDAVARDARRVLSNRRIHTVRNVVDTAQFFPGDGDGEKLDRLAGLSPADAGTVRVALVATYARWKGHHVFLEAAERVRRINLPVAARFYIVGGPIYRTSGSQVTRAELETRVQQLGLTGQVGFVPFQSDAPAIYRAADAVVHASTQPEPFGLTIIEAMACGRATVVSKAGGAAELFTDGVDAIGFPPGDVAALAEILHRLILSRAERVRLGTNAARSAAARFSGEDLPMRVRAVYASLLPQLASI